jgi:lipopolysaccharide biosynthesis glycosyltransferase
MSRNELGIITHCDANYLSRALALINSLRINGDTAPIHVLCHDTFSLEKLNSLGLDDVYGISRKVMFDLFPELVEAEGTRSSLEFYYLFSPYLVKYLQYLDYEQLVYLDSDLYFFGTLELTLSPVQEFDIGIVPHRFDQPHSHLEIYGVYNVGLVYFRNNRLAMSTLEWWAKSCLQSTKIEVTETSFGDQKYLQFFELMKAKIHIFDSHGHNAAPWNNHSAELLQANEIAIRGEKLCYFHFSSLRIYRSVAILGFAGYGRKPSKIMKKFVYRKYINEVLYWENTIGNPNRIDYRRIGYRSVLSVIKYRDFLILWGRRRSERKLGS